MTHFDRLGVSVGMLMCGLMACSSPQVESSRLGLHVAKCTQGHAKVASRCGTFGVYENREARTGGIIALRFVVLNAKHSTHQAIAEIPGGPGQSAVAEAPLIADNIFEKHLSILRDRYDIVFLDARGMGGSHAFNCHLVPRQRPDTYFRQLWPDGLVAACRRAVASRMNPSFYNTNNAVDDFNDLRDALGYRRLVLHAGSYGTFFSFVFVRRHPDRVESAVLQGVAPPHFQPLPGAPLGAQHALDDLVQKCHQDALCSSHFPNFADHFAVLVRLFDRGPVLVPVKNAATGRYETVALSKEVFVDRLRQILYEPESASSIPYIVERAYHHDFAPLGQATNVVSLAFADALDWGAFLSYSCSGEMPFISQSEVRRQARLSFAGDFRIRAQRHACSIWNVAPMPPSFDDVVRTSVPILMIAGSDDPATPPQYARQALPYLPNAKLVTIRGAGHITETACSDRLIVQFVRSASAQRRGESECSSGFKLPAFDTSMAGWPNP